MSHGRHSRRPTLRRRLAIAGLPLVAAAVVVGTGLSVRGLVASTDLRQEAADLQAATPSSPSARSGSEAPLSDLAARSQALSRSAERRALTPAPPRAVRTMWTTGDLDLRVLPHEHTRTAGLLQDDRRIGVTGRRSGAYAEVVVGRAARWVTASYLSPRRVVDPAQRPLSSAPCPDGSGIESAIQPQSVKVYRAVCAAFPELTSYGGQDGHGEHVNGEAIDFMVPSAAVGERVKDFLYAHHAELDLFDIIWSQHIWTIERSGEGFRSMEDRGSPTANHMDHVHIKIN